MPETNKIIRLYWYMSNNIGDNINYFLVSKLSGKVVTVANRDKEHFIVCGSTLSNANEFSTVWGAGFDWIHHRNRDLNGCENVIAVRGDLSAECCGMDVMAIGDPALLLPMFHNPKVEKKYKVGIIPHWGNIEKCANKYKKQFIINPLSDVYEFVNNILSCENVFSESLHGLIISDTYGVKNTWLGINDNVGDGFKFRDYYSSTENPETEKIKSLDTSNCIVHKYKYDLNEFLNSCPFYNGKHK